eukprot:IDg6560t1
MGYPWERCLKSKGYRVPAQAQSKNLRLPRLCYEARAAILTMAMQKLETVM